MEAGPGVGAVGHPPWGAAAAAVEAAGGAGGLGDPGWEARRRHPCRERDPSGTRPGWGGGGAGRLPMWLRMLPGAAAPAPVQSNTLG